MGCTSSKVEDGVQARPVSASPSLLDPSTLVWTAEDSYAKYVQKSREKSVASGRDGDLETFYNEENTTLRALGWLKDRFRYIDAQDGISQSEKVPFGACGQQFASEMWLTGGHEGLGVAALYLVHAGKDNDTSPDKKAVNKAIMEQAQNFIVALLSGTFVNTTQFMRICVIVGNNVTICTPYPDAAPIVSSLLHKVSREEQQWHKSVAQQIKAYGAEARGAFNKLYFEKVVREQCMLHAAVSVWDDGELAFSVDGKPYQWGSRLLVTRAESKMKTHQGIKATHFKVNHPFGMENKPPIFMFKMLEGSVDPGGVEVVSLFVATDPSVLWPKVGQFKNSQAFRAAELALMQRLLQMQKEGVLSRCKVHLQMGQEQKMWFFIGHDLSKDPPANSSEPVSSDQELPVGNVHLASFGIDLEELPRGIMYDEDGDFQGILGHLRQRYVDSERAADVHAVASIATMTMYLDGCFPGAQVSDQGELIVPSEGDAEKSEAQTLKGSRLFVVRDPAQAPKDVVGVVHLMALPDGMKPTGHYEDSQFMKDGEAALLKVMKKMYENGEISDNDCTAIVQACFDTTVYQFVEGNKFVDYSETQMLRFQFKL